MRMVVSVVGALLLYACSGGSKSPTSPTPASAPVPTAQRDYLVALYNGTNGPGWFNKTNWTNATPYTPDTDPCGEKPWYGVTCSNGNVIGVELPANFLIGVLPEFTGMSYLQTFDVGPRATTNSNQLRGQIPSLGGLTALRVFRARAQQFEGPIPSLSGLSALQEFDIGGGPPIGGGNSLLSGPLPSLNGLTALRIFRADNIPGLTGPIPSLNGLVALQQFDLSIVNRRTGLTGPIPGLSGLTALREFRIGYHDGLSGPIPSLSGLAALQTFDVGGQEVSGQLPDLSGLAAMTDLRIRGRLSGPIPASLSDLRILQLVVLCCGLSGSIPSLVGLRELQQFDVENNLLTGPLPSPPASPRLQRASVCRNTLRSTGSAADDAAWEAVAWEGGLGLDAAGPPRPVGGQLGWLSCQCPAGGRDPLVCTSRRF